LGIPPRCFKLALSFFDQPCQPSPKNAQDFLVNFSSIPAIPASNVDADPTMPGSSQRAAGVDWWRIHPGKIIYQPRKEWRSYPLQGQPLPVHPKNAGRFRASIRLIALSSTTAASSRPVIGNRLLNRVEVRTPLAGQERADLFLQPGEVLARLGEQVR